MGDILQINILILLFNKREYGDIANKVFIFIGLIYLFIKIRKYFQQKNKVNYLLKHGKKIEITIQKSSVTIKEHIKIETKRRNNPSGIFTDDGIIGVDDAKTKYYCTIQVPYSVNAVNYVHTIKTNMREYEVSKRLYKAITTTLVYDLGNPQNCIIDTSFLD